MLVGQTQSCGGGGGLRLAKSDRYGPVLLSPLARAQAVTGLSHGHTGYVLFKAKHALLKTAYRYLARSFGMRRLSKNRVASPAREIFPDHIPSRPRALSSRECRRD